MSAVRSSLQISQVSVLSDGKGHSPCGGEILHLTCPGRGFFPLDFWAVILGLSIFGLCRKRPKRSGSGTCACGSSGIRGPGAQQAIAHLEGSACPRTQGRSGPVCEDGRGRVLH